MSRKPSCRSEQRISSDTISIANQQIRNEIVADGDCDDALQLWMGHKQGLLDLIDRGAHKEIVYLYAGNLMENMNKLGNCDVFTW